jgi:hypothetical protein
MQNQDQNKRPEIKFAFDVTDTGTVHPVQIRKSTVVAEIPARIYRLEACNEHGMHLVPENDFTLPKRIYGKVHTHAQRIMRAYELGEKNHGTLLIGDPGSGKTLTLKQLAMLGVDMGYPVILVNQAFPGPMLAGFLATIKQQCIVAFDEFDKKYGAKDKDGDAIPSELQDAILEILDGALPGDKKLYVLTANEDAKISKYLKDRPSRIRYTIPFKRIDIDTVIDYVSTNLKDCSEEHIRAFLMLVIADSDGFKGMNFDSMVELVNEMNNFKCSLDEALELMIRNGKHVNSSYEITVFKGDKKTQVVGGYGKHNGVYVSSGDYVIDFTVTVPAQAEGETSMRVKVELTKEHFVGFGEEHTMFEYKYGDYTFMVRLVDYGSASTALHRAHAEYAELPDVKAAKEQKEVEKKKQMAEGQVLGGRGMPYPSPSDVYAFHTRGGDDHLPPVVSMQALFSSKHFDQNTKLPNHGVTGAFVPKADGTNG